MAVLLLGVLTLAMHNAGVLPSNAVTSHSLLIGSALEMVPLSFALAVGGRLQWVNGRLAHMPGCSPEALTGQSPFDIHVDGESWERLGAAAAAALVATGSQDCERRLRRRDGAVFRAEMRATWLSPEPAQGVVWSVLYLTARGTPDARAAAPAQSADRV